MVFRITLVAVATTLLLLTTTAHASATYGLKFGMAASDLVGDVDAEPFTAVTAGVFLAVDLYPHLDFVLEALYVPRGADDVLAGRTRGMMGGATDILTRARYDYLEVPFLLRLHPVGRGWFALAGPSFGIVIGEDIDLARDYPPEVIPYDVRRSDLDYRANGVYGTLPTVDPSLCVGLGYHRLVQGTDVGVEVRANFGLRNLTKYGRTVRNRTVTATMILGF